MDAIFGERFLSAREPAWHGLGELVNVREVNAVQAIERARMDYQVTKMRLCAIDKDNKPHLVPKQYAVMREPVPEDNRHVFYGVVGQHYQPLQNRDLANAIQPLVDRWPIETVGALGDGQSVFFSLDAGETDVADDPVKNYFLVHESKTGKGGVKIAFTPVRVVCQNTLVVGLKAATVSVSLSHYRNAKAELASITQAIGKMEAAAEATINMMRRMANVHLQNKAILDVLNFSYKVGAYAPRGRNSTVTPLLRARARTKSANVSEAEKLVEVGVQAIQNSDRKRTYETSVRAGYVDAAMELLEKFNDEMPMRLRNTGWGVYNAVVETEDFRRGPEGVSEQALFGVRAAVKKRAFDHIAALV